MNWHKMVFGFCFLAAFLASWLGRYEIIGVSTGEGRFGVAYRLDRWTGGVVWLHSGNGAVVKIED